jgi:hypothetical protein
VDAELRWELLARGAEDQRVRRFVALRPGEHQAVIPGDAVAELERVDHDNSRWLGQVLAGWGWPGWELAGDDGAAAAWLLAQHADDDPALQHRFLEALRAAVAAGDASAAHLAYLEDRVRVNTRQPQLYGTQFIVTEAGFGPLPIADPDRLDMRRAAVGLEPFAVYDAQMRAGT